MPAEVAPCGAAGWSAPIKKVGATVPATPVATCIPARGLICSVAALRLKAKLGDSGVDSGGVAFAVDAAEPVLTATIGSLGTRLLTRQSRKIPAMEVELDLSAVPFVLAGALEGSEGPSEDDPDIP